MSAAKAIWSETLPAYEIKPILPNEIPGLELSMHLLGEKDNAQALERCRRLADEYRAWIESEQTKVNDPSFPPLHKTAATKHLETCRECHRRILDGVALLESDADMCQAFAWMNQAMLMQQVHYDLATNHKRDWSFQHGALELSTPYHAPALNAPGKGRWRPFQLAFILMNLRSMTEREGVERKVVDLIWFPTGGGKTEIRADIRDYLNAMWDRLNIRRPDPGTKGVDERRFINRDLELTSRIQSSAITEVLQQLFSPYPGGENRRPVDVCLATNMIQVGLDVPRLGLMTVVGQPKTTSEYIQATSRVGRSVFPGLVVAVLNAAKPRDRSHFETFFGWHSSIYRDVEATSVTPFASRARDRALHAALVAMIRHSNAAMIRSPKLSGAPDDLLKSVVDEIERRVNSIDPREASACESEINERLDNWDTREPTFYVNARAPNKSLLISADLNAQRRATGRLPPAAWPTMNNMRSVEASTRFRMTEGLSDGRRVTSPGAADSPDQSAAAQPRWR